MRSGRFLRWQWINQPAVLLVLIALLAGGIRLYRLDTPTYRIFDEGCYTEQLCQEPTLFEAAGQFEGVTDVNPEHPPLGKWMIRVGIAIFGDSALGWRVVSVLAGASTAALTAWIAFLLFGSKGWLLVAGIAMSLETLNIAMSRLANLDILVTVWVLLGFLFLVKSRALLQHQFAGSSGVRAGSSRCLLAAGLTFGAACATKWSGVLALIAAILVAYMSLRSSWTDDGVASRRRAREPDPKGAALRQLLVPFFAIPLAVYLIAAVLSGDGVITLLQRQSDMVRFQWAARFPSQDATHSYPRRVMVSAALLLLPERVFSEGGRTIRYAFIDPVILIASVVAVPYVVVRWFRLHEWVTLLLIMAVFVQSVPWLLVRSPYAYYLTPVAPFAVLLLIFALRALVVRAGERIAWIGIGVSVGVVALLFLTLAIMWPFLFGVHPLDGGDVRWTVLDGLYLGNGP